MTFLGSKKQISQMARMNSGIKGPTQSERAFVMWLSCKLEISMY